MTLSCKKYSPDGKLLMKIGEKLKFESTDGTIKGKALNSSHTLLNKTVGMAYDASTGDLYVGDGEGNSRVVVFDKDGKYLRQFGRLATKEESEADAPSVFTKSVYTAWPFRMTWFTPAIGKASAWKFSTRWAPTKA